MSISAVVPFAEMLTLALVITLFVRISLLYRADLPVRKGSASPGPGPESPEPVAPAPVSSDVALASYIDELLLGLDDNMAQPPEKLATKPALSAGKPEKVPPKARPAASSSQPYQPIAVFLTSRYDAGST